MAELAELRGTSAEAVVRLANIESDYAIATLKMERHEAAAAQLQECQVPPPPLVLFLFLGVGCVRCRRGRPPRPCPGLRRAVLSGRLQADFELGKAELEAGAVAVASSCIGRLDWDLPRKRLFLPRNVEGARHGRGQGSRRWPRSSGGRQRGRWRAMPPARTCGRRWGSLHADINETMITID
jgi:hypothetical protein